MIKNTGNEQSKEIEKYIRYKKRKNKRKTKRQYCKRKD